MKNENFALESSLGANYLTVRLKEPVQLDEIAVNVINEDCPKFLIPFHIVNVNGSSFLKYKLVNTVALEYCNTTMRKAEFIRLYINLLTPFVKGNDWFLDYRSLCIDKQYVFLDKTAETAYFIYIPEASYRNTEDEILQFFKDAFIRMTITDDADFQVRIFRYFTRGGITLEELYILFEEESRRIKAGERTTVPSAQDRIKPVRGGKERIAVQPVAVQQVALQPAEPQQVALQSEKKTTKPKEVNTAKTDEKISTTASEDDAMQELFGEKKAKKKNKKEENKGRKEENKGKEKKQGILSVLGKKKEKPAESGQEEPEKKMRYREVEGKQKIQVTEIPSLNFTGSGEEERTEINDDSLWTPERGYLELIDSPIAGAVQRIDLNFSADHIVIGRRSFAEVQPDVPFGEQFTRMGRRHARIERRGNAYYVIDLGSANHTLLNGRVLVPNQPYELADGSELSLTESKPVRYRVHL